MSVLSDRRPAVVSGCLADCINRPVLSCDSGHQNTFAVQLLRNNGSHTLTPAPVSISAASPSHLLPDHYPLRYRETRGVVIWPIIPFSKFLDANVTSIRAKRF